MGLHEDDKSIDANVWIFMRMHTSAYNKLIRMERM